MGNLVRQQNKKIVIGIDGRLIKETGVGRYTKNLFRHLLTITGSQKYNYDLFQPKIRWHSLAEQIFLPLWLLFKNYDLVHFTYFSLPIFYPKKFVVTIHDLIPWHFSTGKASRLPLFFYRLKHFFYRVVLWIGARRAQKIIAVSQTTKEEIIEHLKIKAEKIKVIYEGVAKNFQLKKRKSYFLYVGNAYPHKNLESLIKAFQKIENYKLILVGPKDYFYQRLEKEFSNNKNIVFYGPAEEQQLISLYQQAQALINPSLMEGFGLPGLEAMACGCPVICADIPAFKEIYQNAAIYFEIKEGKMIKKIREAINKFLAMTEKDKKDLIFKGKKQAEKYSWEECSRQTLEVYESCLGL